MGPINALCRNVSCDVVRQEIVALTRRVLNDDATIVDSFSAALRPYRVLAASVIPLGACSYSFAAVASSEVGDGTWLIVDRDDELSRACLLYTSPSPRDRQKSRMPSSA